MLVSLGEKSYTALQGSSGDLTTAGKYYYAQTGQAHPGEFDGGTLQQRGATEYLVRAGKARVMRRLKNGEYTYTPWASATFENTPQATW